MQMHLATYFCDEKTLNCAQLVYKRTHTELVRQTCAYYLVSSQRRRSDMRGVWDCGCTHNPTLQPNKTIVSGKSLGQLGLRVRFILYALSSKWVMRIVKRCQQLSYWVTTCGSAGGGTPINIHAPHLTNVVKIGPGSTAYQIFSWNLRHLDVIVMSHIQI